MIDNPRASDATPRFLKGTILKPAMNVSIRSAIVASVGRIHHIAIDVTNGAAGDAYDGAQSAVSAASVLQGQWNHVKHAALHFVIGV